MNHFFGIFLIALDYPYYSVTDERGEFTIKDVPAGAYKIQACHEVLGNLEKGIDVQAIKPVQVNFDILPNE